ncbi:hypothetical protein [Marinomonas polaris]|uniref:hypothetical protein n=1 Tax=Marinomonas polaris TaxID=293552 RepID=UPI00093521E6|nr:hypothetical protein [Marinomonas polaris]
MASPKKIVNMLPKWHHINSNHFTSHHRTPVPCFAVSSCGDFVDGPVAFHFGWEGVVYGEDAFCDAGALTLTFDEVVLIGLLRSRLKIEGVKFSATI